MTDRDKWITIALFLLGASLMGLGAGFVNGSGDGLTLGIVLALSGGIVFGLSGATAFRWQTGTVSRRRTIALVGSFLLVAAGDMTAQILGSERIADAAFLVLFIPVFVSWLHTYRAESDAPRTDERMQYLGYKAAAWVLVAIIGIVTVGMLVQDFTALTIPSTLSLTTVGGISLFGWYVAFRYLQAHN